MRHWITSQGSKPLAITQSFVILVPSLYRCDACVATFQFQKLDQVGSTPITGTMKKNLDKAIEHEENYVAFLKKRLESTNFKENVSPEEYALTKEKYDKAKFKLKLLKGMK